MNSGFRWSWLELRLKWQDFVNAVAKTEVSIKGKIILNQFRVLSFLQEGFLSTDTFSHHHHHHHHLEDKSKILDYRLRINSAVHLGRFYISNWFIYKISVALLISHSLTLLDFTLQPTLYDFHKSRSSSLNKMKTLCFIFSTTVLQTYNLFSEKLLSF